MRLAIPSGDARERPPERTIMLRFRSLIPALAGAIFINAWTAACAAPFAYVPNEKSGSVSVIDIGDGAGGAVVRQIAAGKRPRGIAVAPTAGRSGCRTWRTAV
jgi:YVTN family beta-propeller protein